MSDRENRAPAVLETLSGKRDRSGELPVKHPMLALGILFLRHAESEFENEAGMLAATSARRTIGKEDYVERGVPYIPAESRFSRVIRKIRQGGAAARILNSAMRAIEAENEKMQGTLPGGFEKADEAELRSFLEYASELDYSRDEGILNGAYDLFIGEK